MCVVTGKRTCKLDTQNVTCMHIVLCVHEHRTCRCMMKTLAWMWHHKVSCNRNSLLPYGRYCDFASSLPHAESLEFHNLTNQKPVLATWQVQWRSWGWFRLVRLQSPACDTWLANHGKQCVEQVQWYGHDIIRQGNMSLSLFEPQEKSKQHVWWFIDSKFLNLISFLDG